MHPPPALLPGSSEYEEAIDHQAAAIEALNRLGFGERGFHGHTHHGMDGHSFGQEWFNPGERERGGMGGARDGGAMVL